MKNYKEAFINAINAKYGENAKYVLKEMELNRTLHMFDYYEQCDKDEDFMEFILTDYLRKAEWANNHILTPATAKVGNGATICLWSDRHACTIIKVTKTTVTVRRDKATLKPEFKPDFIVGGFSVHCTNQEEQDYTYEADENGTVETFYWSNKYNQYGTPNNPCLIRGRHEYYDYNF